MLLHLTDGHSFGRVWMKNPSEKIIKLFIILQRRGVKVSVLDLFAKVKAFSALMNKLFFEGCLIFSFELERVLMNKQIEEKYSCSPDIDFDSVAIFREVLWCQEGGAAYNFEYSLFPFDKLAKRKVIEKDIIVFNSDFFRSNISIDQLIVMQFFQNLNKFREIGQCLL